jgi:hypothetical protein
VEVIDIEETEEAVDLVERVCALDIGKARYDLKLWIGPLHEGATYPPA